MKVVIALVLCSLSVINAYDFEDQIYNEILHDEFLISNPRARRDTKPNCINQDSCCNDKTIQGYHNQDRGIYSQCQKELNVTIGRPDLAREEFKCVLECIGKKKGYLNADGVLLKNNLLNEIKERMKGVSWLKPKLDELYNKCLTSIESSTTVAKKCNDIGLSIGHCIWKETQLECPLDQQANPTECEGFQKYLRENKDASIHLPIRC